MSNAPRAAAARRNWGSDETGCTILHVDMDAFFASVEVARNPRLAGKPVVVGAGDRSVVLAATYEARALGVRSGAPIARARVMAPQAIYLVPDHSEYHRVSKGVMEILHAVTPLVEQVSVDEAFLDVSGSLRRLGTAHEIGESIRAEVYGRFGVTCSVGIARSKFVAKLASTNCKPDGLMLIPNNRTVEFVQCLPVGALWGVGAKTAERLASWGITEVAQLAALSQQELSRMVGQASAAHLLALAWGKDEREVSVERVEKSVSAETTFAKDLFDTQEILAQMLTLADHCASRLRARQMVGRTVSIKVRNSQFETITRSVTLRSPTQSTNEIYGSARELFLALKRDLAVRLIGVRIEGLEEVGNTLFQDTLEASVTESTITHNKSERVLDEIRAKFGSQAIERAAQAGVRLSRLNDTNYP